jgi:hypothetical protein
VYYFRHDNSSYSTLRKCLNVFDFKNNFNKINQLDKHDDGYIFGIKDIHTISTTMRASKTKPELILSNYVMTKYRNALDFIPK